MGPGPGPGDSYLKREPVFRKESGLTGTSGAPARPRAAGDEIKAGVTP
jgi:hypothetical protein